MKTSKFLLHWIALLLCVGTLWAQTTPAHTKILNQATAVYRFQDQEYTTQSNLVITEVTAIYGVSVTPDGTTAVPGQQLYSVAGATVLIPYTLVNTGNDLDSCNLTAIIEPGSTFNPSNIKIAWDINANGQRETSEPFINLLSNVPAGDRRHLLLSLDIPATVAVGGFVFMNIAVQSTNDATASDNNNVARVDIVAGPVIRIAMSAQAIVVAPGQNILYTVTGSNIGGATALPVPIALDGVASNGFVVAAPIPEVATSGTMLIPGTTSCGPGTVVYSTDNGATWTTTLPVGVVTNIGLFFAPGLAPDATFRLQFQVQVSAGHAPGIIENQSSVFFQNSGGTQFTIPSNKVEDIVGATHQVFVGPQGNPFANVSGDTNADFQILPLTNCGAKVTWKMTVSNSSTSADTLNIYLGSQVPATWICQIFGPDGISPLLDTNGDNLVDLGVVAAGGQQDLVLSLTIPVNWQPPQTLPHINIPVWTALAASPTMQNRTYVQVNQVTPLANLWRVQKINSPAGAVYPGTRITYSLTFNHLGTVPVTAVAINDIIPAILTDLQFAANPVISDENGSGNTVTAQATYDVPNRILSWQIASVLANFRGRVSFSALVPNDVGDDVQIANEFSLVSSLNSMGLVSNRVNNFTTGTTLHITKDVNKRKAELGDVLIYTINVSKTASNTNLNDVRVVDTLPRSFRYGNGTTMLNGQKAVDPEISANGQTLTFHIGTLTSSAATIRFMVKIGPDAEMGDNPNLAYAYGSTAGGTQVTSFTARAITTVSGGVFAERAWIFGRVYVDRNENDDYDCATDIAIPGVKIYLENGQYAITDREGKYVIEDLRLVTHVVAVDTLTLPPQMKIRERGRHAAFHGKSQFADLKMPGPWRADFTVELAKGSYLPCPAQFKTEIRSQESVTLFGATAIEKSFSRTLLLPADLNQVSLIDKIAVQYALQDWASQGQMSMNITFTILPEVLYLDYPEYKNGKVFHDPDSTEARKKRAIERLLPKIQALAQLIGERFALTQDNLKLAWDTGEPIAPPSTLAVKKIEKTKGILSPADGAVYMLEDGIKVKITSALQNRMSLLANGQEVPPAKIGTRTFNIKSSQATLEFVGVPLRPGKNIIQMIAKSPLGKIAEEDSITVYKAKPPQKITAKTMPAQIPADGRTEPIVIIELVDDEGKPATSGLFLTVTAENTTLVTPDAQPELMEHQLCVKDGKAECILAAGQEAKEAKLTIKINNLSQEVKLSYLPYLRDWIIVGLGEGTLGIENVENRDDHEGLFVKGRAAFFVKGRILGKLLLTAHYDSGLPRDDDNALLKKVDPDKYYPVYGDNSQQGYELQSSSRLYVKLEQDRNYIMFGDYQTEMNGLLTTYNRTFLGLKGEMRTDYLDVKAFGTRAKQALVKDEIRGQGLSGYYFLSHNDVIENTLQVAIETRDRFQTQRILNTVSKRLYVDFDANFTRGTLLFDTPIPSADEEGNPVYIVATYESKDAASREYIGGVQVDVKLLDEKLKVGGTYVYEGQEHGNTTISGIHAEIKPLEKVTIRGEIAQTRSFDTQKQEVIKGRGYALEANADLDEIKARAGYQKISAGFRNPSVSGVEENSEKYFAEAEIKVTKDLKVQVGGQHAATKDHTLQTAYTRSVLKTGDVTSTAGYQFYEEERNGEKQQLHSVMAGVKVDLTDYLRVRAERFQVFPGTRILDNQPLPDKTFTKVSANAKDDFVSAQNGFSIDSIGDRVVSRTILGADLSPYPWLKLWASQEFQDDFHLDLSRTLFGVNLQLTRHVEMYTTYGIESSVESSRNQALAGLRTNVPITNWLSGDIFLERIETFNGGSDDDFTAYGFGLKMARPDQQGTARFEFRHSHQGVKFLATPSITWKVDQDMTWFWRTRHFQEEKISRFQHNSLLGLSYRPACSDHVNLIWKGQLDWDKNFISADRTEEKIWTSSIDLHYRPYAPLDIMTRYACKYVQSEYVGGTATAFTDMTVGRILYELDHRFDAGIHGGMMWEHTSGQLDYAYGVEIGVKIVKNLWLSAGYNLKGFKDRELAGNDFLREGFYVTVRFKFDEETAEELLPPW